MSLDVGNLFGAVTDLQTAFGKDRSLKRFLHNFNKFGAQTTNNFEVNFSGLPETTFFVQTINFAPVKQNFAQLYYDGRVVDIPMNPEYEHSGTLQVLNDAKGYIYSALTNFLVSDALNSHANSGYTMTIKALTGDTKHFKGMITTLRGVRIEQVDGLSYNYAGGEAQIFSVQFKYIDFSATPGGLKKAGGILGALEQIVS